MTDDELCYRALQTRDPRFDGRFFTGVRSTGIFCRPICPARTPRRENCDFYPSAAAAQAAGFRPCLRCRPEAAPGTAAWVGTHAVVARAVRLIEEGFLDASDVPGLADRLGVGERHLRRLFLRHVGASPAAVAGTRRVLFAKKLLDESDLPMTQVATAAGFGSLRRFNDALRRSYGRTPRELRRSARKSETAGGGEIRLRLSYRPPLDWSGLLGWLGARAIPGVEVVGDDTWSRSIRLGDVVGVVSVRPASSANELEARLRMSGATSLGGAAVRLRRVFDLECDPTVIAAQLGGHPALAPLVAGAPGVRIPGAFDPFELAVRAVLGQQVTVAGATTLAGRLVERFGTRLDDALAEGRRDDAADSPHVTHLFPTAPQLAAADLQGIGLPGARARALNGLAMAVAEGRLALDGARGLDATVASLSGLPGIGDWTAQYVALRAFGEPDAFPASDLGLRKAFARGGEPVTAARLEAAAEAWRPWRGYAALLLWGSLAGVSSSLRDAPVSRSRARAGAARDSRPG